MKYRLYPRLFASGMEIEIEADSKKEAIEKAYEEYEVPTLCWQCSNDVELSDGVEFDEKDVEEIE